MRFISCLLFGLVSALASGGGVATALRSPPTGWRQGSRAALSAEVSFTIALQQRNVDVLEDLFWRVSTPGRDKYRQFMQREEILAIVQPPSEDRETVRSWLIEQGVSEDGIRDLGDAFGVDTHVDIAERLFQTTFHHYHSTATSTRSSFVPRTIVRALGSMSLPSHVQSLIQLVTGIDTFPAPHYRIQTVNPSTLVDPDQDQEEGEGEGESVEEQAEDVTSGAGAVGIIAQTIRSLYDVPARLQLSSKTSQGVIQFGENYSPSDLVRYAGLTSNDIRNVSYTIGHNQPQYGGMESTLDVDMMYSINTEADNWYWVQNSDSWFYTFTTNFFNNVTVPDVISISYGLPEDQQCSYSGSECSSMHVTATQYVQRVNVEFQKIGLRGVSILVASGDSGANGSQNRACFTAKFFPDFPGSSAYVTAVGATEIVNNVYNLNPLPPVCKNEGYQCPSGGDEQAVSYKVARFTSGGGFSDIAPQPSYQQSAVTAYFNTGAAMPPSSYYNASGRGYPDVAALGYNSIILAGGLQLESGTSASAPIWGAIVALLNQAAYAKDDKPLGFLNPLLYQIAEAQPSAFHDITVGDNKCTDGTCAARCQGFLTTKGWDPVTGLGSPNFPNLLSYIKQNL